jgi:peptide/nickel transport system substrate-binding protein
VIRSTRLTVVVAAFAATLAVAAPAVTASASSPAKTGGAASAPTTLRMAFNADMQVPDPDIFYEVEGNEVVTSAYEGLVRYKPNSPQIEGALADSWTVSPDGMTYTFKLHPGVKFQTGPHADANPWIASFKRRTDLGSVSAPGYMLAQVATTAAPDPLTFVVTLKEPVSAFLDYLAAPYGPKAVDPAVVAAHDEGGDLAQNWLKSHSAGTGPYYISKFDVGQQYVLTRNDGWWGSPKPYFQTVEISIIPEISTQRLKLESGDLDLLTHGLPVSDVDSFKSNSKFQVKEFPVLLKTVLASNPNKGIFKDPAMRKALTTFFDKKDITNQVYQGQATVSTQMYPVAELPKNLGRDISTYNPSALTKLAAKAKDKNIDLAYSEDEGGTLPRLAEILAAKLQAAGFNVKVRGLPIAQVFALPTNPDKAPDLLLWTFNPDAAHPDTWVRIFMNKAGGINYLQCSDPNADAAMDTGLSATTTAAVQEQYGKAGDLLAKTGCYVTLSDVKEEVVARKGLTGFVHQLPTAYTVRLSDLKGSSSG